MSVKLAFISAFCALALGTGSRAEGIEVHHPYAISTGVGGRTGAVFLAIHNHNGTDDALIDVRSDAARLVQLHQHVMTGDGIMSMVHVTDPVAVPADGELLLDRGGFHIMFMGLNMPFDDGALIPVTLVFAQAGEVQIEVPVDQSRFGNTTDAGETDMSETDMSETDMGETDMGDMDMGDMDMATE